MSKNDKVNSAQMLHFVTKCNHMPESASALSFGQEDYSQVSPATDSVDDEETGTKVRVLSLLFVTILSIKASSLRCRSRKLAKTDPKCCQTVRSMKRNLRAHAANQSFERVDHSPHRLGKGRASAHVHPLTCAKSSWLPKDWAAMCLLHIMRRLLMTSLGAG